MLPDVLQVLKTALQFVYDLRHTTKTGYLERFAPICGDRKLYQPDMLFCDFINMSTRSIAMPERQLVVIPVIEDVKQVAIEGVNVLRKRQGSKERKLTSK